MIQDYFKSVFKCEPTIVAQAPGRLEFIGNHVDYNNGVVMGVAIDNRIYVAVSPRDDNEIHMASEGLRCRDSINLDQVKLQDGKKKFMNYPLGVLDALMRRGMKVPHGFNMADTSTVPSGAGVSSSAAIELATAYALCALYNFPLNKLETVLVGKEAENKFVGMPCGILDQGVSGFGEKDAIVRIDCKTNDFSTLPLPAGTYFWVFNSGVKHALVAGDYAQRHDACMKAADIVGKYDAKYTCLADASASVVMANRSRMEAAGAKIFERAKHVVEENARVIEMQEALKKGDLTAVGNLMYASHCSSRDLFENSCPEIDFLVEQLMAQDNVYGARLSGGGFGGIAIALTNGDFSETQAAAVAAAFEAKFGKKPNFFKTTTGKGAGLA
ncbi:MAG: galactokinase [Opitutales bacterium]|nr:galactokinase [Opitutales bacterium]